MSSPDLVLLCARTARSVTYLQALHAAGIVPDQVLVYGQSNSTPHTNRAWQATQADGLFLPDLKEDVSTCLERLGWPHVICAADALDDPVLLACVKMANPGLLVYSGYGGQLVPAALLKCYPVLHIHSGWLPDYRGSTTIYYQILEQRQCAASALLLDESIDTGPVLARKVYPLPPAGLDVDYVYDNTIRADLLVQVLSGWRRDPASLKPLTQEQSQAQTPPYFIIHPLLKHLALLAVDQQEKQP
ncbi:formyltransferase family protein [Pseudomonas asplenii]|uniref:formyltransferase family protein n=1 Tax=Pseudomonas asplenii TaxID=53407 RepID=UPI0003731D71|nr:formyltransferase family protein [Pseudomonas fuscovaginae]